MKAISLWQPWASLWLSPAKIHETRHWPTRHRGWTVVHAAQRFEKNFTGEFADVLRRTFGAAWYRDLPTGAIIGVVNLIGCVHTESIVADARATIAAGTSSAHDDLLSGNFDQGRWGWRRGEFHRFETPIPYRGAQGFFNAPDELLAEFHARAA